MSDTKVHPEQGLRGQARDFRRVLVNNLEQVASVGVYEHEKRKLQRLIISLELDVIDDYDAISDHLSDVYDYDLAIRAAQSVVSRGHTNLLETLAERIATACLEDDRVMSIKVTILKPDVEAPCDSVGIEIWRPRR